MRVSPFSRTPHNIQDFIRAIHVVLFGVKAVSRQILYGGDFGRIEVDEGARWSSGRDRSVATHRLPHMHGQYPLGGLHVVSIMDRARPSGGLHRQ